MAKNIVQAFKANTRKKRKGVHSKNASKGQTDDNVKLKKG